jgi:uncharacterized protein (DUF1778 family)
MRTDRIEARVEPKRGERIRYAAELEHTSVSAFITDAAAEKAERVIAEHRETVVPADFFDSLLDALDDKTPNPALRKAAKRARASVARR